MYLQASDGWIITEVFIFIHLNVIYLGAAILIHFALFRSKSNSKKLSIIQKTIPNIKNYRKIMQRHIQLFEPGESLYIYIYLFITHPDVVLKRVSY